MYETNISFYLKSNRVHIYTEVLRGIGSPKRICFMIGKSGQTLLIAPYNKRDFKSHGVPGKVYESIDSMEISSIRLCRLIADTHNWDITRSYRVPGKINIKQNIALFELSKAEIIRRNSTDR